MKTSSNIKWLLFLVAAGSLALYSSCDCDSGDAEMPEPRLLAIVETNFPNTFDFFEVTTATGAQTFEVPDGRTWTMQYEASDAGGIRELLMEWEEVQGIMCQEDMIAPVLPRKWVSRLPDVFDQCKQTRIKRAEFGPQVGRKKFHYHLAVEDWDGNGVNLPVLTIFHKPCQGP